MNRLIFITGELILTQIYDYFKTSKRIYPKYISLIEEEKTPRDSIVVPAD
jgi:hypothetical protein